MWFMFWNSTFRSRFAAVTKQNIQDGSTVRRLYIVYASGWVATTIAVASMLPQPNLLWIAASIGPLVFALWLWSLRCVRKLHASRKACFWYAVIATLLPILIAGFNLWHAVEAFGSYEKRYSCQSTGQTHCNLLFASGFLHMMNTIFTLPIVVEFLPFFWSWGTYYTRSGTDDVLVLRITV